MISETEWRCIVRISKERILIDKLVMMEEVNALSSLTEEVHM
jgi:hypothetical protein